MTEFPKYPTISSIVQERREVYRDVKIFCLRVPKTVYICLLFCGKHVYLQKNDRYGSIEFHIKRVQEPTGSCV